MIQQKLDDRQIKLLEGIRSDLTKAFDWENTNGGYVHWLSIHQELSDMVRHSTSDGRFWVEPEPPKPTYRPFANAKEFMPHCNRWMRRSYGDYDVRAIGVSDYGVKILTDSKSWEKLYQSYTFTNGEPCGVKVETTHGKIETEH